MVAHTQLHYLKEGEKERERERERERSNQAHSYINGTNFTLFILALQLNTEAIPQGLYNKPDGQRPRQTTMAGQLDQRVGGVP